MIERWKTINEAPRYNISNMGNIYSMISNQPKRAFITKGYMNVQLYTGGGEQITRRVHRLVAQYFVKGYNPKLEVNHKDCDKSNNCYSNLEWVTSLENTRHAVENNLLSRRRDIDKLAPQLKTASELGYVINDIAELHAVSVKTIRKAIRNAQHNEPITTLKTGRRNGYIYFDKSRGKWRTEIRKFNQKNRQFDTLKEAKQYIEDNIITFAHGKADPSKAGKKGGSVSRRRKKVIIE